MYYSTDSSRAGKRFAALVSAILIALGSGNVNAETVKTVNGTPIDSSVFDIYLTSRTQRPVEQVTAEERDSLLAELTDIYLLSTGEAADEVANDPQLKAQLELQRRGAIAQAAASKFFENVQVSEEEILAAYDEQVTMAPPLQFKARHILVESQGEAMQVIGELEIGGDFEELAKTRSTGPSSWRSSNRHWG